MENVVEHKDSIIQQQRLEQVGQLVGNTPLYPLRKVYQKEGVELWAKLEWQQMGHSVKTRAAYNIIREAIKRGTLDNGRRLLDASSGNTAVALAAIGSALDISVTLVVPENIASQKLANLKALGAELVFSSRFEGTDGAQDVAKGLATDYPERYWYADQYNNADNWKAHYQSTAAEIYRQTGKRITHFVAGLGTTGTFTGTVRRLQELDPAIRSIALQPELPMHGLEGWKHMETAKVPGIFDATLADENIEVGTEEAFDLVKRVAREEGLVLSPSAAANLAGAMKVANKINTGTIVTIFPDAGYNYPEIMKELFT